MLFERQEKKKDAERILNFNDEINVIRIECIPFQAWYNLQIGFKDSFNCRYDHKIYQNKTKPQSNTKLVVNCSNNDKTVWESCEKAKFFSRKLHKEIQELQKSLPMELLQNKERTQMPPNDRLNRARYLSLRLHSQTMGQNVLATLSGVRCLSSKYALLLLKTLR